MISACCIDDVIPVGFIRISLNHEEITPLTIHFNKVFSIISLKFVKTEFKIN